MNLEKKKNLSAKALKVGKKRIVFVEPRMAEIKEVLTRQDIKDLHKEGAILIKNKKGRKKNVKKKKSKSVGNIRKKPNKRKREYMFLVRKLRKYVAELKKQGKLSKEEVTEIRKKIRNKVFRSKAYLKTYIQELKKWKL